LAPRIDAEGGDYRGLVVMAGTPRRLEEVLIEQNEEMLSMLSGLTHRLVRTQVQKLNHMFYGLYDLSDEEARRRKVGAR